jgi:hypothetical protein
VSVYPTFLAGRKLTASLLTSGQLNVVRKLTTESVTSNATPQNDDELFFDVEANAVYRIEAHFFPQSTSLTPDFQSAWSIPAGATGLRMCHGPTSNSATYTSETDTNVRVSGRNWTTAQTYQIGDANAAAIYESGLLIVSATAGTVQFQWAQGTSNATATDLLSRSFISYQRVG